MTDPRATKGRKTKAYYRGNPNEPCQHRHQRHSICMGCDVPLCLHHHHSLRGCMRERNHEGPHSNPNAVDRATWTDAEGYYITSKEEWSAMIGALGKNGPTPAPSGSALTSDE